MNKISKAVGYFMLSASGVGAAGGMYNGYKMAERNMCKTMEKLTSIEKTGEYMCSSMIIMTGAMLGATLVPLAIALSPMYGAHKLYKRINSDNSGEDR